VGLVAGEDYPPRHGALPILRTITQKMHARMIPSTLRAAIRSPVFIAAPP
jgi:hypothetical protein